MSWEGTLKEILEISLSKSGDLVFIGVGNPLRSDDGVGVMIATELGKVLKYRRVKVLVLEDRVDLLPKKLKRLKPAALLFFDAADFGGEPGEVRLINIHESARKTMSAHEIPLDVIVKLSGMSCPAYILGVQVWSLEIGGQMNPAVRAAGERIVEFIARTLGDPIAAKKFKSLKT